MSCSSSTLPPTSHATTPTPLPNHDANNQHIKRPMNCFMLYKREKKSFFLLQNPRMNNRTISRLAAIHWHQEPEFVKELYRTKAKEGRSLHSKLYPDYKYKATRKTQKTPKKVSKIKTESTLGPSYSVDMDTQYYPNLILTSPMDSTKKLAIPLTPDVLQSAVSLKNPDEFFCFESIFGSFV